MGMLLTDTNDVANVRGRTFWETQLANDKILLHQIDLAIMAFNTDKDGIQSYTIDTGQDKQTVTRADLASLNSMHEKLIKEINEIEQYLNPGPVRRICPGF